MSEVSSPAALAWFCGSAALFLCQTAFAVMVVSASALGRVALRRIGSEGGGRLRFVEDLRLAHSARRIAVHAAREGCLLAAAVAFGAGARAAGWPRPWLLAAAVGLGVGVLGIEVLLAGPLALGDPRSALRRTGFLLEPAHAILRPLAAPASALARRRLASGPRGEEIREADPDLEVDAFIEVGEREGILEEGEGRMVRGIVELGDTRVREIMVPRTDIVAVPAEAEVAEARRAMLRAGHSRLPVFRGTVDDVVGILHVRDVLRASEEGLEGAPVSGFVRPALFVPETQRTSDLLLKMRSRAPIALVVDEYGGLAGLVTLEDLLEEIVGDIRDEHDPEDSEMQQAPDGSWSVSGLAHVEEIEALFGVEFGERDFDTVGGLVVASLGRVPEAGEKLEIWGLGVEVLEADRRRVYRVRFRRAGPSGAERGSEG